MNQSTELIQKFRAKKGAAKLVTLTAVDYPTALWCRNAGVDLVLVGDSLGMVSFGMPDTTEATLPHMVAATEAAARALKDSGIPLVADLPFDTLDKPLKGGRTLVAAGANAVKVECHAAGRRALECLVENNISVMAHVGLLPQEVKKTGGYRVHGRAYEEAEAIIESARAAQESGAFACVIENVPEELAERITTALTIPTIGIGAGGKCDGQILVLYDLLGVYDFKPRFARRYADFGRLAGEAIAEYAEDVRQGRFPAGEEITR